MLSARSALLLLANRQYKDFVGSKPLPAPKLDHFTDQSWQQSALKVFVTGDPVTEEHVQKLVRKADFWARDAERGALLDYTQRDPRIDRWARVDPQPPSCPFCTVLISRGAVYGSKDSAVYADLAKFHTGCTCTAVLVGPGQKDSFPGVEFRNQAVQEYATARKAARSGDLSAIVAAMQEARDKSGGKTP